MTLATLYARGFAPILDFRHPVQPAGWKILGCFLPVSGQLTPLLLLNRLLYLNCTPATLTPLLIGRMV
jgi:hypothetical protein